MGEFWGFWSGLDWGFGDWGFGPSSEKGSTRKSTGNRVTSWRNLFWGNLWVLRCFTKRIVLGESEIGLFGGFTRGSARLCEEGGPLDVHSVCLGEFI
jgi:hypothetical protein